MANEVVKFALDESRAALKEQDATLGSLRNRATGLLAATSIGTSLAAGVGFLNVDPGKGSTFPTWAGWTLLPLTLVIGASVMAILWPVKEWRFGPTAEMILSATDRELNEVWKTATRAMIEAARLNDRSINWRVRAYQGAVLILTLETTVLLLALIVSRV